MVSCVCINMFFHHFPLPSHHSPGSTVTAYFDTTSFQCPTVRHSNCAILLSQEDNVRCNQCTTHRLSLGVMASRHSLQRSKERSAPSSHTNFRYLSTPEKVERLRQLHQCNRSAQKKLHRLKARIAEMISRKNIQLDVETTSDLCTIM